MPRELYSDVQLDHPWAQKYRLPVLNSWYPQFYYIITVAVPYPDDVEYAVFDDIEMPTEEEAAMLGSYLQYKKTMYNPGYITRELDSKPLDIDSGVNTTSFVKRNKWRWGYVRSTWRNSNPVPGYGYKHLIDDLEELLDLVEYHLPDRPSTRWSQWKAEHPDIFKTSESLTKGLENV